MGGCAPRCWAEACFPTCTCFHPHECVRALCNMDFCTGQEDLHHLVLLKTPAGGIRAVRVIRAPQLGGVKSRHPGRADCSGAAGKWLL